MSPCACDRARTEPLEGGDDSFLGLLAAGSPGPGAGRITLPGQFLGWSQSTPLNQVLANRAGGSFQTPGNLLLYRISVSPAARAALGLKSGLLYIGMAWGGTSSIRKRLLSHIRGTGLETGEVTRLQRVFREMKKQNLGAGQVQVQIGRVQGSPPRFPLDPKLLRAYEAALQVLERPSSYVGTVTAFEAEGYR